MAAGRRRVMRSAKRRATDYLAGVVGEPLRVTSTLAFSVVDVVMALGVRVSAVSADMPVGDHFVVTISRMRVMDMLRRHHRQETDGQG